MTGGGEPSNTVPSGDTPPEHMLEDWMQGDTTPKVTKQPKVTPNADHSDNADMNASNTVNQRKSLSKACSTEACINMQELLRNVVNEVLHGESPPKPRIIHEIIECMSPKDRSRENWSKSPQSPKSFLLTNFAENGANTWRVQRTIISSEG